MSTASAVVPERDHRVAELIDVFLAGHWSARTRANYAFILADWGDWCADHQVDVIGGVDPRVVEAWIGHLQARRYAANTIAGRISAVSAFYRWCLREQLLARARTAPGMRSTATRPTPSPTTSPAAPEQAEVDNKCRDGRPSGMMETCAFVMLPWPVGRK